MIPMEGEGVCIEDEKHKGAGYKGTVKVKKLDLIHYTGVGGGGISDVTELG